MRAEEIIFLLLVLPGLGDVYRNPTALLGIELRPAVITGNFAGILVFRQRETDLEFRWNVLRPGHGDKHRMEVGAVAAFGVAGPQRVSFAPAAAALVIAHGREGIVIERASSVHLRHARFHL